MAKAKRVAGKRPVTPLLSVDCIVLGPGGRVLFIERGHPPFEGCLALPGGFVDEGETVEDACRRELMEETGVTAGKLMLVGVYSKPGRDPRGSTVTVAYLTKVRSLKVEAGDDAAAARWIDDWRAHPLAFDHAEIVADAMKIAAK